MSELKVEICLDGKCETATSTGSLGFFEATFAKSVTGKTTLHPSTKACNEAGCVERNVGVKVESAPG